MDSYVDACMADNVFKIDRNNTMLLLISKDHYLLMTYSTTQLIGAELEQNL